MVTAGETYTCRKCGAAKPVAEFFFKTKERASLYPYCRDCSKVVNRDATGRTRRANPVRTILKAIKSRAKSNGLDFNLTEEDLVIPTHCPILGIPLRYGIGFGRGARLSEKDRSPSVDRIDNSKGYVRGNIIVVSYRANRIKSDAEVGELTSIARFYEQLATAKGGQAALPPVQSHTKEQAGAVPFGFCGGQRVSLVLPQLRMEGRK